MNSRISLQYKMSRLTNKRAAMEMSVGTMVTIVLLMLVLVLGIFFIQKIFRSGTNAIDIVDSQVQNQMQKLFADEDTKAVIYPTSRDITIKRGDSPKGFAISIYNQGVEDAEFTYTTSATDVSKCGSSMTEEKANNYLFGGSDTIQLAAGEKMEGDAIPIIRFDVPESAPACTIIYKVVIEIDGRTYTTIPGIAVTFK